MAMTRVAFFIDGFNLYHAMIGDAELLKTKWLDLSKLGQSLLSRDQELVGVYYFTAYPPWDANKQKRHMTYERSLIDYPQLQFRIFLA